MKKFKCSILRLCEELHMNCTGDSKSLSIEQTKEYYEEVKMRIENWKPRAAWWPSYDFVIKHGCELVLKEAKCYLKEHYNG